MMSGDGVRTGLLGVGGDRSQVAGGGGRVSTCAHYEPR